ncbi:MAG: NepR family anti-sigma factor [Rhodosalinus sp.]
MKKGHSMQATEERVSGSRKPKILSENDVGDSPESSSESSSIDANLRRVYEELVEDEVPERFKTLLEQLRRQEQGR